MRRTRTAAAAAATALVVLAGCATQPEAPRTPGPAPSPTYSCTPDAGGAPVPCTPEQYTEQTRINLLYAEATKNYQRYFTEYVRLLRAGGTDKATPALTAVAGGPYLEAQLTYLRQLQQLGGRIGPGDIAVVRQNRFPGATSRGYDIALATCIDSRAAPLLQGEQVLKQGRVVASTVYFKRDAGVLKLWDGEEKPVESC